MSEPQHDKPGATPNSEPTPKPYTKESLPGIIDLPPSGRACVIGGLPPLALKASGEKPELHLADAKQMTLDDVLNLFRRVTGREPTPEEIEDARREWESDDGESEA